MCLGHQGIKNKEVGLRGLGLRASGAGINRLGSWIFRYHCYFEGRVSGGRWRWFWVSWVRSLIIMLRQLGLRQRETHTHTQ